MRLRTALHLIDPNALCPPATPGSDAQALALLERVCGREPRAWSRELGGLYHAQDPSSAALACALADRLWLRPSVLLPPGLPAAHWAGALDQLGRQHAGRGVIVVALHTEIAPAAACLLRLQRAFEPCGHAHGIRQLALDAAPTHEYAVRRAERGAER